MMAKRRSSLKVTPKGGYAPPWQTSEATYLACRAHLDGADHLAVEMERKWGVGRLRLLVSAEFREKFDRQRVKLNEAIAAGGVADVQREADRMVNAYRALDRHAEAAGAKKRSDQYLEVPLSDGRVLALLIDPAGRPTVDGRALEAINLDEVARLYEGFPALVKTKQVFPGATVTVVRRPDDPLEAWERNELNDDLPFAL